MNQILVVRSGALGDTILTLPLLASIRRIRPDCRVSFLGSRAYRSLIPPDISFQGLDSPEWVWLFSEAISPLPGLVDTFREAYVILDRPDTVVAILRKAGIKIIQHTCSRPQADRHVVESMHEGLGMPSPPRAPVLSHMAPAARTRNFIWLHPGSGSSRKCIPLDVMASVAEILKTCTGWDLVVTAGEEDAFLLKQPAWERLTASAGTRLYLNRALEEICEELGAARLFVGNDSGMSHLAAGLGVPSVVFFVSTNPAHWAPWVPESRLKAVDFRCADCDAAGLARACLGMIEYPGSHA